MLHSSDEIRGVLVQAGDERVLLPNATVAEVLARAEVEPVVDAPDWLAGTIAWHGWQVPLVSFARFSGLGHEDLAANSRVVVLKALGGSDRLPYFALLTHSFPRLVSVPRDGLLADATEEVMPPGVQVRVLLGEETALLPHLEGLEAMLLEVMPAIERAGDAA